VLLGGDNSELLHNATVYWYYVYYRPYWHSTGRAFLISRLRPKEEGEEGEWGREKGSG